LIVLVSTALLATASPVLTSTSALRILATRTLLVPTLSAHILALAILATAAAGWFVPTLMNVFFNLVAETPSVRTLTAATPAPVMSDTLAMDDPVWISTSAKMEAQNAPLLLIA